MRGSRPLGSLSSIVVASLIHVWASHAYAQTVDAAQVLAASRAALGGDARIAAVKTFVVTGRTRQVQGDNLVPIEFEIQSELPDKYSRRDEIPARDTGPTTTGFNGDKLVQIPPPPVPVIRAGGPPPPTPEQLEAARGVRVANLKQDFARLMLGMFATSYSSFPLTFDYVAQAEAPQGKADVIDVKGPQNFAARLFISSQTHLPIMVSWQVRAPAASPRRGGPAPGPVAPPQGASPQAGALPGAPPQPAPVEHRLYFGEYREVDGLQLPSRVRHAVAGETTEETTFDRFRINARIDPRRFDVSN